MSHVNELLVFIASPSDLADERQALVDIEHRINARYAGTSWRVRVTGWEQLSAGYGRPQGQINPMVDACDVFIGLLRRRWGTPTGEAGSGFEEEFERAMARRKGSTNTPQIAIYFAALSAGELDDPGQELQRVLAFRRHFETKRIGLYDTFAAPLDLAAKVSDLLHDMLIQRIVHEPVLDAPSGAEVGTVPSTTVNVSSGAPPETTREAQMQLMNTINGFGDLLAGRQLVDSLDTDRLELFATAFGRDEERVRSHLINRLYRRLDKLSLIFGERHAWIRTLLADISTYDDAEHRTVPGFALIDTVREESIDALVQWASDRGASGVGALRALRRMHARPAALWPTNDNFIAAAQSWAEILNANSGQSDAINYLLQGAAAKDFNRNPLVELCNAILGSTNLAEQPRLFVKSALRALKGDAQDLATRLVLLPDASEAWLLVLNSLDEFDDEHLTRLCVQTAHQSTRKAAVVLGLTRKCLTDATLRALLFDSNSSIRRMIVDSAASDAAQASRYLLLAEEPPPGEKLPPDIKARLMASSMTAETLRKLPDYLWSGNEIFEAKTYALAGETLADARQVLDDATEFRSVIPTSLPVAVIDYLIADRQRIAADVLARTEVPTLADAGRVTAWFASLAADAYLPDHAWRALSSLARTRPSAIPEGFFEPYADILGFASAATDLDGPLGPLVGPIIGVSKRPREREPAALWRVSQPECTNQELKDALRDELASVRAVAAELLCRRLTSAELKSLLHEYSSKAGTYWYNVVVVLDEYLYAVPRLRRNVEVAALES